MIGAVALWIVSMLQGVAIAAGTDSAPAREKPQCEQRLPGYGTQEIECHLNPSEAPQRLRFTANFSGSHDDTTASMEVTFNGSPLACEDGSKTSLAGEDGDVSLECRFSVAEKPEAKQILMVALRWRHAEYTSFEIKLD